ncbi:MAG: immunoglobulin domain-containing protein [Candidatus Didemnitutus sp.]|nr:immunoglobulin domain-containing protein [Candidatus Didemnitutus sp.]
MRNNFLTAGVLLAVLVTGPVARAYDIIRAELTPFEVRIVKWLPGVIPMQIKLGTAAVLQDGTNHSTSVLEAMNDWNAVIGRVQFEGTIAAAGVGGGSTNGINEIFFSNTVYGTAFGSNTIAVMLSSRSMTLETDGTFRRTQADIIFNSARLWNSYRGATQSGLTDIRRVALHELGHVLGLDHPDDVSQSVNAVMNSTISNIDSLQRDDREGAQFLYQPPGPIVRPVNDDFADAIALTLTEDAVQGTIVSTNATKEPGEPNHVTTRVGGASVWWQWTAIENGDLTASTPGTTFDTQLAVYTGSAVDALNLIASHDDISVSFNRTSTATFAVNSGTTYHIAVDGREGESGTVKLNLNFKSAIPRITTQPVNRRIQEFQSTTFFVAAVGAPPLTYQWQYRSVGGEWSNLPDGSGVAGTTAALLNLTAVTRARAGEYRCLVSTARGAAASAAATLIVDMASPKIVTQPQSQTVARGGTATLTAVVSGSEPMIFRWQKTTGNQVIAGATSATLVIPNIQFSDQDSYRLTVTNEAGSITSNYTWLTVIDLPQIATQPKGQTVFRTTPFWLAVSLGSGGSVTYQWFRNGAPIAGATSSEYSVASAEEAHAGSYTVAVTNVAGTTLSDAAEIEVIALPPPQNIRIGSNPTVPLGVDISIGITASQTWGPSLSYQWYRNGVAIPGATLSYYSASNATVASFGEYYVTITNASGTGVSNTQSISYRHPRFNESSAQYWVAAQEVDGVVYFFFQDTPRVTRYDLASETWLSTWTLPSAPRAVAFATDAIYVASATEVVRYSRELLNPTSLLALADIRSLLVRGEQLLVAAGNNSPANYRTINRQTGQQISTLAMYGGASNGAAYSQIDQGIYFINTNSSSARLERLVWREDGTFGSYVTVTDLSRSLNGRQAFVVRNGSLGD